MERCAPASLQKAEPLLSTAGRRRELRPRGQKPGEEIILSMDPELLKLPLGVKIPVPPNSKPVFTRAKLGEKLHRPSGYFNLRDPYSHLLGMEYNSLHDPHLQEYYHRKDNLEKLKREGRVTRDGQVVCTLKEFNEYRQYLTTLRQEAEQMSRQEEKPLSPWKDAHKLPGAIKASLLGEQRWKPRPAKLPPLPKKSRARILPSCRVMQHQAERTGQGRTSLPETAETVKTSQGHRQPKPEALAVRAVARDIVESVLKRTCQSPWPLSSDRTVPRPPTAPGGGDSCPAEGSPTSMAPHFAKQPLPPVSPKPPSRARTRRTVLRIKLVQKEPRESSSEERL
ncbi:uncharacterized protein [Heliangelus exortis]|uniref:uncharacterized protein isoform X2 n=1 Tax=Heliangelus exortis TaxID=472823 RepID=UPI003A92BC8E